jgi:ubiquinone/menaquinone biosynthesis C-methylase UbiE
MDTVAKAIKQYDEIAEEYAEKVAARLPFEELSAFKKYVSKRKKVLDLGCAAGRDTSELTKNGYIVTGVDLSEKLLEIAKKKYPSLSFSHSDIRSLPFKDESYDAVWAIAVFHHLDYKDMLPTLKEFNRVLKNHGIVFIKTKKGEGRWKVKEDLSLNKIREFTLLSPDELDEMLTKTGFIKKELYESKSKDRDVWWVNAAYCKIGKI